jgi:hypothetical protein
VGLLYTLIPDNMHYVGAPVLVNNIELEDPITGDT